VTSLNLPRFAKRGREGGAPAEEGQEGTEEEGFEEAGFLMPVALGAFACVFVFGLKDGIVWAAKKRPSEGAAEQASPTQGAHRLD
jgi:hypothetical protein